MSDQRAIVEIRIPKKAIDEDIEIPLSITVSEMLVALNKIYGLNIDIDNMANCYIKSEFPIALIRGGKPLESYGVRNGTIINIME